MNPIARTLLPAACACAFVACDAGAKRSRVALVPTGAADATSKAIELGARRADEELDDLEIVWHVPSGAGDPAAQIAQVAALAPGAVDGLCLAPVDAIALDGPVRAAVARGLPVVVLETPLASADAPVVSTVAADDSRCGELAAEEMVRLLGGRGKVLILRHLVGSEATRAREESFLHAILRHPNLQVVSRDRYAGPDEARALVVSESILAAMGEELDGVFCSSASGVAGFLTALERDPRQLAAKIRVVGCGASPRIVAALEDGTLAASVVPDPVQIGYRAVQALHARLSGRLVEPRIDTEPLLATRENLATPEVRARLDPLATAR